jgi:trigger factor
MRFKASFEVLPEIEVAGYQELRPERKDTAVSEEDVANALNTLQQQHSSYTAVEDRELRDGDYAQVSLTGAPTGASAAADANDPGSKPVTMDEVMVEIGGADTLPEFTENLRGARPGEERSFDVAYPEGFSDQRLAGKTLRYSLTVKAIKQKQVPELNDDFAREVGEFQTLDELKAKVREQLESEKRHEAEQESKEKLVDQLVERHDFPVPEALIDRQIEIRLERGLRALAAHGMKAEDMKKMDFRRMRAGQREAAVREVKASLILEKIAQEEHIEVSDAEIDHEVEALARQTQQTAEAVRARLTRDGALDRIRNRIRSEKTLDFLYRRSA